jgi:hypothetical protein
MRVLSRFGMAGGRPKSWCKTCLVEAEKIRVSFLRGRPLLPDKVKSKVCTECRRRRPITEFSPRHGVRRARCIRCSAKYEQNRRKDPAWANELRKRDRKRGRTPERRAYDDARKSKQPELVRRAHLAVIVAVKSGKLVRKPCEVCGKKKSQAHHDDYSKPLDVRWLCQVHHSEHHRKHK